MVDDMHVSLFVLGAVFVVALTGGFLLWSDDGVTGAGYVSAPSSGGGGVAQFATQARQAGVYGSGGFVPPGAAGAGGGAGPGGFGVPPGRPLPGGGPGGKLNPQPLNRQAQIGQGVAFPCRKPSGASCRRNDVQPNCCRSGICKLIVGQTAGPNAVGRCK